MVTRHAGILLVEDVPALLALFSAILREVGYRAVTAATGQEAIRLLQTGNGYDLAIIDYRLPDVRGTTVAAEALERHPGMRILFVTAYADEFENSPARPAGSRILVKPFRASLFIQTIEEMLGENAMLGEGM